MNRIAKLRKARGMTQPELSEILNAVDPRMDVGMVSRFENGVCVPTDEVMEALLTALQASERDVYGEDGNLLPEENERFTDVLPENLRDVLARIPKTPQNMTSAKLAHDLGIDERQVRKYIAALRRIGHPIVNMQDGRGFYMTTDIALLERQYKQDTRRAMAILARRKVLRRLLKNAGADVR